MDRETLDRIVELARPETVTVGGQEFATHVLQIPPEPRLTFFELHTLTGLVHYILENRDGVDFGETLLVVDETQVTLASRPRGRMLERDGYARALAPACEFDFGKRHWRESLQVGLLTWFEETPDREELLAILGNLQGSEIRVEADNGVAQNVTVRTELGPMDRTPLKTLWNLRPYRTFREIEQPESPFLLRLDSDEDRGFAGTLTPADGGRWKIEARERIAEYLADELADLGNSGPAILA